MQEFMVKSEQVGLRVDVFLSKQHPQFARSALGILFDNNLVQINDQVAKAGSKLKEGDVVSVNETVLFIKPEPIDLPILYEDEDVIVINKPAGILTHSKGNLNLEETVATFIQTKILDKNLSGNRAGIVHRLDRSTSGVMIGAKNSKALLDLQKQFSQRKTKKIYYAIVEDWPEPEAAVIDAPLERNSKKPQTFRVGAGGKSSQTEYKTVKRFKRNSHKYAVLELRPATGRTHQLRVHLSYINHPIVGDRLYGKEAESTYLHAAQLELNLPSGEHKVFKAPLPKIFKEFSEE